MHAIKFRTYFRGGKSFPEVKGKCDDQAATTAAGLKWGGCPIKRRRQVWQRVEVPAAGECGHPAGADCYDRAILETFFQTIKFELVRCTVFYARDDAAHTISSYIDGFYSPVRRHSAHDYIAPRSSNELHHAEHMPLHFYGASRTRYVGSWRDLPFNARQPNDRNVPRSALRLPYSFPLPDESESVQSRNRSDSDRGVRPQPQESGGVYLTYI